MSLEILPESSWKATAELVKLVSPADSATCRNTLDPDLALKVPRNEHNLPSI